MRIIAGDFKGRRLYAPDDYDIRPTTDKVKEAMFSIAAPYLEEGICVDLFTGTGNLGLEALSRGASKCYFCDNSRKSLALLQKNLRLCKAGERAAVIGGDYRKALARIGEMGEKIDVFFLDPPYEAGYYEKCLTAIAELKLLAEDGMIIAEHRDNLSLPEETDVFRKEKERKYGSVILSIYASRQGT